MAKNRVSYPGACLCEGILNAFCHANYFILSNIKVEFFEKEAKITNPGCIYQATLEQILDGVQTYRNPGLANILSKLNYIENFGTGIQRILDAYKNFNRKPEFLTSESFFILRLPNLNYNDPLNDQLKFKDDNLNEIDISILSMISIFPGLIANKLSKFLKMKIQM